MIEIADFLGFRQNHQFDSVINHNPINTKSSTEYNPIPALEAGRRDLIMSFIAGQQKIPAPLYQGQKTKSRLFTPWVRIWFNRGTVSKVD